MPAVSSRGIIARRDVPDNLCNLLAARLDFKVRERARLDRGALISCLLLLAKIIGRFVRLDYSASNVQHANCCVVRARA